MSLIQCPPISNKIKIRVRVRARESARVLVSRKDNVSQIIPSNACPFIEFFILHLLLCSHLSQPVARERLLRVRQTQLDKRRCALWFDVLACAWSSGARFAQRVLAAQWEPVLGTEQLLLQAKVLVRLCVSCF